MAVADYITKNDLEDALESIRAEMVAMEKRLESRLYTTQGELIGRIEASEKRIVAEIRNGR